MEESVQDYCKQILILPNEEAVALIKSETFGFVCYCAHHDLKIREICRDDQLKAYWCSIWLSIKNASSGYVMQDQPSVHPFDLVCGYFFYCEALMLLQNGYEKNHPDVLAYYEKALVFHSFHAMRQLFCLFIENNASADEILVLIARLESFIPLYLTPACILMSQMYNYLSAISSGDEFSSMYALQYLHLAEKLFPYSTQSISNVYDGKSLQEQHPQFQNWSEAKNALASELPFQVINCAFESGRKQFDQIITSSSVPDVTLRP